MTQTTATTEKEYTKEWEKLSEGEITCCLAAHCTITGLSWKNKKHMTTMKRIFDLGRPKITFATNGEYCRIAEESVKVMTVLIKQYL